MPEQLPHVLHYYECPRCLGCLEIAGDMDGPIVECTSCLVSWTDLKVLAKEQKEKYDVKT